jgi:hypothetical protein
MASGILGQSAPSASTNTTVYTVPALTTATFNVSFCNTGTAPANVRLAVCTSSTPAASEYLEYDYNLLAGGVLERSGIVAQAAKLIVVYTDTANVAVSVYGYEA